MFDVYKLKFTGEKNYFEKTFSNSIDALQHASDIFTETPIEVYRKKKYHKRINIVDRKNCFAISIRCGAIKCGGNHPSVNFFEMMFGHKKDHINNSNEFNNFM